MTCNGGGGVDDRDGVYFSEQGLEEWIMGASEHDVIGSRLACFFEVTAHYHFSPGPGQRSVLYRLLKPGTPDANDPAPRT